MHLSHRLRKILIASGIIVPLCFINVANLRAQSGDNESQYLAIIAQNTTAILAKMNNLPQYLINMVAFGLNWQTPDDSTTTANMQTSFDMLGQLVAKNTLAQNSLQTQLTADMLGNKITVANFSDQQPTPTAVARVPGVNDLSYASMLGNPPASKAPFSPYNYVKYASGGAITHTLPVPSWNNPNGRPTPTPYQSLYVQYFNTLMAIESFGTYTLSNLMVEQQNGSQSTSAIQNSLIAQVSNSNWVAQVASEELGKVLRQILIFQSQSYVLMTQLLQTQKQLLTASVMTNTLLILNNRTMESYVASKAQGMNPSP